MRRQTVHRVPVGDGHIVMWVDVDPATCGVDVLCALRDVETAVEALQAVTRGPRLVMSTSENANGAH